MIAWIKSKIFIIKYKLGLAREGIDFFTPGFDDQGYMDAVAENCPEYWDEYC